MDGVHELLHKGRAQAQMPRQLRPVAGASEHPDLRTARAGGKSLHAMPGVAECALVGVPHPDFGEVGVAVVIAKPGAAPDANAIVKALKAN